MKKAVSLLLVCLFLLTACGQTTQPPRTALPEPGSAPAADPAGARDTARRFLDFWEARSYAQMYDLLTRLGQDATALESFTARYRDAAANLALAGLQTEILGALGTGPHSVQVSYTALYHSALFGDLTSQMVMNLAEEDGQWRVQWEDGLIHPALSGGNRFSVDVSVPARGNIYDRGGHALAAFTDAVALGVVPGQLDPEREPEMLTELASLTGKSVEAIHALYGEANPEWYIPIGEASAEAVKEKAQLLSGFPGLQMSTFRSRYYFDGSVAPHVVGYLQPIPAGEAEEYALRGYLADEKAGATGLEAWGEEYLRGKPRASLYVLSPQGQTITRLAQVDASPAQSITTTLDKDLQAKIQKSMGSFRGAVVVLERDSGRVLAMVSNPSFDANLFEPTNQNSDQLAEVLSSPDTPLLNRATQGVYPLGSVFKIITMAAGLESGRYDADSEYSCGYVFEELPVPFYDWTYSFGVASSGILNLQGALIRSCNPWFWHIGLDLYNQPDLRGMLTEFARGFGLGSLTGIGQVVESAGSVPVPETEYEAIGLAIGQDELQVTPLQVASYIAAVGNGGTLYRPQLVEKIAAPGAEPVYSFQPEERGRLPVSPQHLKEIQEAMFGVVNSAEPQGTAYFVLANLPIPTAGKTGTAQTALDPHAWFGGYTLAEQEGKPDIAVAVIVENAGEGSMFAAPIFRRVVQLYFSDGQEPGALLPWESSYYTPAVVEEPVVEETAVP